MKRYMKSIFTFVTVLFLTAALTGSALAAAQVPFKGTVEGVESYTFDFLTMYVATTASGEATQLGHFTVTWQCTVNLLNESGLCSSHYIAANGDSLYTTAFGQGTLTETPDVSRVVEAPANSSNDCPQGKPQVQLLQKLARRLPTKPSSSGSTTRL